MMTSIRLSALLFLMIPPLAHFARLFITWMPPVSCLIGEGGCEVGFDVIAINGSEMSQLWSWLLREQTLRRWVICDSI